MRDPFSRSIPYFSSCPELLPLFNACQNQRNVNGKKPEEYSQLYAKLSSISQPNTTNLPTPVMPHMIPDLIQDSLPWDPNF
jgi:hypothetical protein